MSHSKKPSEPIDFRRWMLLLIAVSLGGGCIALWWWGDTSSQLYAAAMGRISLVLGALWLAQPSLRRPAQWLPPGMAVGGVILLAVLAAQPRLFVVAIPIFFALLTVAAIARTFNR
jgi:hypothetical protein